MLSPESRGLQAGLRVLARVSAQDWQDNGWLTTRSSPPSWLFGEGPLEMDQDLLDRALRNGGTVISVRMMGEEKAGSGRGRGTRPIGHPGSKLQKPSVSRRCPGAGLTASSKR